MFQRRRGGVRRLQVLAVLVGRRLRRTLGVRFFSPGSAPGGRKAYVFTETISGHLKGHVFPRLCVETRGPSAQFREIVKKKPKFEYFARNIDANLKGRRPVRIRARWGLEIGVRGEGSGL